MAENNLIPINEQEAKLGNEVSSIELKAQQITINSDQDFTVAGKFAREIKAAQKKVEEFWEPMRASTYQAYKSVTDHKKAMIDPLKGAENILKRKMSSYQMEQERKRKEAEEKLRKLAQEEVNRKIAEAAEAEKNGDLTGMEYAMAEAEVMDDMSKTAAIKRNPAQVKGVSQSKSWVIRSIDLSKLPAEFAGVLIRPADEKAIMGLIKGSKGQIKIPGVEYEETVSISVRAS